MATDLDTTPTMIFTLAAKEGGWTQDALDHNIPLRNPFGRNRINKKGEAAGNVSFPNLQAAVTDWETHIVAAPYVHGIKDPGLFVDTLLAHNYNKNKVPYRAVFMSIAGSMPGHMAACGVNP